MQNSKGLIIRGILFLLIYFVFTAILQFTPLKNALASYVCSVGNTFNSTFYNGGEVKFRPIADEERKAEREKEYRGYDILVILKSKKQKEIAIKKAKAQGLTQAKFSPIQYADSSWNILGIILSFYLALVIVTPVSIKQKVIAAFIGFIVLTLLTAIKFWFSLGTKYATFYERFMAGFESELVITVVNKIHLLVDFMGFGLLLVGVLWLFVLGGKLIKIN